MFIQPVSIGSTTSKKGLNQIQEVATTVASAVVDSENVDELEGLEDIVEAEPEDPYMAMLEMKSLQAQLQANNRFMQTALDVVGTVLDIKA